MSIPATLQHCLDLQNVSYDIVTDTPLFAVQTLKPEQSPPHCIITSVILEDSLGVLQVLFPSHCMLDLTQLCELMGRNLQIIPDNKADALRNKLKLDFIPAVPQLTGLTTIADQRLLQTPVAYLAAGTENAYLELHNEQLRRLLADVEISDFCSAITDDTPTSIADNDAQSITRAIEKFTTLRIKQRLEETLEIPPLPDTAEEIIKLRVDPDAAISDLAAVVGKDPSLSAQVVSWASSPYYAAPGKITSVQDAVVRVLGFDLVINLALGLSLGRSLSLPTDGPRNELPYWQQAVYCAATMAGLARRIDPDSPTKPSVGLAYLSGLLHNFGYLLLSHIFPPYFSLISRHIETNPHVHHEHIENLFLGISREQMAGWLMDLWHMPEEVGTALRWQHQGDYCGEHCEYPNLLFVSLNLLRAHGVGNECPHPIDEAIFTRLHLTIDDAHDAVAGVLDKSDDLRTIASELDR